MKRDEAEILDAALAQLAAREELHKEDFLASENGTLAGLLETAGRLKLLVEVEQPAAESLSVDRAAFLADAATRRQRMLLPALAPAAPVEREAEDVPVSNGRLARLKGWTREMMALPLHRTGAQQKERRMIPLMARAAFVVMLALGSIGGTVAVAEDSLPGSTVYPVKLALERARLALNADSAGDAALHLMYAGERVAEMERLAGEGTAPGEASLNRLQVHLEEALQLSAGQPEEEMMQLLLQAQNVVQTGEGLMRQVQVGAGEPSRLQLQAALAILHQIRQQVEAGLQNPQTFRDQHGFGRPETARPRPEVEPPGPPITHTHPLTNPHGYGPGPGPGQPSPNPDCPFVDECEPQQEQQQQHLQQHQQDQQQQQPIQEQEQQHPQQQDHEQQHQQEQEHQQQQQQDPQQDQQQQQQQDSQQEQQQDQQHQQGDPPGSGDNGPGAPGDGGHDDGGHHGSGGNGHGGG